MCKNINFFGVYITLFILFCYYIVDFFVFEVMFMKNDTYLFVISRNYKDPIKDAYDAWLFLAKAYEEGTIGQIENMDDVLEALDISQQLESAQILLKEFNIAE